MNLANSAEIAAPDGSQSCGHCGALVFPETTTCRQCGKFPIKLHKCPGCGCISDPKQERCWKCRRVFDPLGDWL